jgi:hypothetical protein
MTNDDSQHRHTHEHHDHDHHEHVPLAYKDAVEGFRLDKDEFFKTQPGSPILEADRAVFTGLPYYPLDEALVFENRVLEPYTGDEPSKFQMPTRTAGSGRPIGWASCASSSMAGRAS